MSETRSRGACQRDKRVDLPKIREKRVPRKKHGEVSFPTQVRYDIVFLIGPIIIIATLQNKLQATCQIQKSVKKHRVVQFLTRYPGR